MSSNQPLGLTTMLLALEQILTEVRGLRSDLAERRIDGRGAQVLGAAENDDQPEGLLTAAEAAKLLAMSPSWVYQRSAAGDLPCVRVGAALRFDREQLRAYARGERRGAIRSPRSVSRKGLDNAA